MVVFNGTFGVSRMTGVSNINGEWVIVFGSVNTPADSSSTSTAVKTYYITSTDMGATWSNVTHVNTDSTDTSATQGLTIDCSETTPAHCLVHPHSNRARNPAHASFSSAGRRARQ